MKLGLIIWFCLIFQLTTGQSDRVLSLHNSFYETINNDKTAALQTADKLLKTQPKSSEDQILMDVVKATLLRLEYDYEGSRQIIIKSLENNTTSSQFVLTKAWLSLSLSYDFLGNIDSCVLSAKKAISHANLHGDHKLLGDVYLSLGVSYYYSGLCDSALVVYESAWKAYTKANDSIDLAGVLTNQSNCYYQFGELAKSIDMLQQAEKIYEKSPKHRYLLGQIRENIGHQYCDSRNYKLAKRYLENSKKMYMEFSDSIGIGRVHLTTSFVYDGLNEYDLALKELYEAERILTNNNGDAWLNNVHNSIGAVLLNSGEFEAAIPYLEKSLAAKRKKNDPIGTITTLTNLADAYNKTKKFKKAFDFANEALKIADEHSFGLQNGLLYGVLADYYAAVGDFKNGYYYSTKLVMWKDSIYGEDKRAEISELEIKYETEKKEQEILLANLEAEQEIVKRKSAELKSEQAEAKRKKDEAEKRNVYIGLIGLALITLAVFWALKNKRRDNKIISEQKQRAEQQKEIVEEKNKEILDSINYAKRIQTAILPPHKLVKEYLNESFILYKPKDIVAGDFYWMHCLPAGREPSDSGVLFAAADCTGHGVPGAMVSVVCNNGLNRSVREYGLTDPAEILNKTREIVISEFEKSEEEVKDGMDIALCALYGNKLEYAGAHNPLWIIRKGASEVEEIKADKQPIGKYAEPKPYTTHAIELNEGDSFYIFSDGYADQFGGERGKKFKAANFKKLLLSIQDESMEKQCFLIDEAFENWKDAGGQPLEQLDDVCVMGVRI